MNQKKAFLYGIAGAAITIGVVLGALGVYLFTNRAGVFAYFAKPVLENRQIAAIGALEAIPDTDSLARAFQTQEDLVIAAVQKSDPAVFSIVVTKDMPVVERFSNDPFLEFFNSPFGFNAPGTPIPSPRTESRQVGSGSGFFIAADGLAMTNRHVVQDTSASYTAFLSDGSEREVKVVAVDPVFDIAVVRVEGGSAAFLSFADSSKVRLGQSAIAIGNALGEFSNSVSVGVVSGLSRSIVAGDGMGQSELLDEVIQTDAAINPGNSGGPLLDLYGRVIGVNVAVAGAAENIGFALPANLVKDVVVSVQNNGKIVRPYLGVRYVAITPRVKATNNLPVDYGVIVGRGQSVGEPAVVPGSPAAKAGIKENDIILEIDGVKLNEDHNLASLIRRKKAGDTVSLKILRNGSEQTMTATLEAVPN
jgi:serine protease Do